MRLLLVVPRYVGDAIDPAAWQCHDFATRLAARGHTVEVAASCARHAADWADEVEPGETLEAGVVVHRFRVRSPRDDRFFGPLHQRVLGAAGPVAHVVEREWLRSLGPDLPELADWLRARTRDFDVVVVFGHLAASSFDALRAVTGVVPTVLHPFVDDAPELRLGVLDEMFHTADALACNTPEEQQLLTRRFGAVAPSAAIGTGVDIDRIDSVTPDVGAFRARFGLADRPYLLAVGPLDADDGSFEVMDVFTARASRRGDDVTLVVLGETGVHRMHPCVVTTGTVDAATRATAIDGCLALVEPSYRERLSTGVLEAWAHRRPGLVQGRSNALAGEARRSGGAIPYAGFAEFEAAVDLLVGAPELATTLGGAGRGYVELRYGWDDVLARYEWFLEDTMAHWRPPSTARRLAVG